MDLEVIDLDEKQCADIAHRLAEFDEKHIKYKLDGNAAVGIVSDGSLIAGADGCMTAFRIFYISTVFVDEAHRGKGVGSLLMRNIEDRAKALGANMIRLDTFDWQGAEFYKKLGYEQVGEYKNQIDGFSEHFFIKML